MVMCQRPRKPCGTQDLVYYYRNQTYHFNPLYLYNQWARFLSNSQMLCPPYTKLYIPNLKEITPVVHEI